MFFTFSSKGVLIKLKDYTDILLLSKQFNFASNTDFLRGFNPSIFRTKALSNTDIFNQHQNDFSKTLQNY